LVADVVQFGLYLQHALHQYHLQKEKQNLLIYPLEVQREEERLLRDSLIMMKKNAMKAIRLVDGVSELTMQIIKIVLYPRVMEVFWALGNSRKATKYAEGHLRLLRGVGMASFCSTAMALPQVIIGTRNVQLLHELIATLNPFRLLNDVA